jgi:hypothetical protein
MLKRCLKLGLHRFHPTKMPSPLPLTDEVWCFQIGNPYTFHVILDMTQWAVVHLKLATREKKQSLSMFDTREITLYRGEIAQYRNKKTRINELNQLSNT